MGDGGRDSLFFDQHMDALPIYEKLENRILNEIEDVRIKIQKTQISFYNRHLFSVFHLQKSESEGEAGFLYCCDSRAETAS